MTGRSAGRLAMILLAAGILSSSCVSMRQLAGFPAQNDPSVAIRATEPKWLLIKNPRYGDVASEPEYIWVEEDKLPFTMKSFILGKSSMIATPEIVAKYGSPPGGGRISPGQGGAYKVENLVPATPATKGPVASVPPTTRTDGAAALPAPPERGYVVFVDTTRVVIDLTAGDGAKPGAAVSVRRDKITIVHPITGELLGELDEELATGTVTEVREKFSIVEIQNLPAGEQIRVKDRVVLR